MIQLTTEHERLELEKELIKTKILSSKGWYTVASFFIDPTFYLLEYLFAF